VKAEARTLVSRTIRRWSIGAHDSTYAINPEYSGADADRTFDPPAPPESASRNGHCSAHRRCPADSALGHARPAMWQVYGTRPSVTINEVIGRSPNASLRANTVRDPVEKIRWRAIDRERSRRKISSPPLSASAACEPRIAFTVGRQLLYRHRSG
jgi:hypothetical protein